MKIAQLSFSRARGIRELDYHQQSIKFKRHLSQCFYFDAQKSTPKIYVELWNSKKCIDQRRLFKKYWHNHSLNILLNSHKVLWVIKFISIILMKIYFTKTHHLPANKKDYRLRRMIFFKMLKFRKPSMLKVMHQTEKNPKVRMLMIKYIKQKLFHLT